MPGFGLSEQFTLLIVLWFFVGVVCLTEIGDVIGGGFRRFSTLRLYQKMSATLFGLLMIALGTNIALRMWGHEGFIPFWPEIVMLLIIALIVIGPLVIGPKYLPELPAADPSQKREFFTFMIAYVASWVVFFWLVSLAGSW